MEDKDFFSLDDIKNMKLEDLIMLISTENYKCNMSNNKIIYNSQQLLENYPMFSKYSLDIAIRKADLPFFRIGHKRYFEKEAIDKWIKDNNKPLLKIRRK